MVSVRVPVHWLHCFTSTWWMLQPVTGTSSRGRCSRTSPPSGPTEHRWSIRCGSCDDPQGVIKLTHTKRRRNYQYIRSEPRVALDITDPDDPYRYMQIRGVV